MSYTPPTVVASGTTFAQLQAAGVSGHLERLITAQGARSPDVLAATLSETGSGGTLPAATYYVVQTESNGFGETTVSPTSSGQAITLGQNLVITPPSLKTGNIAPTLRRDGLDRPVHAGGQRPDRLDDRRSGAAAEQFVRGRSATVNTTGLTYVDSKGITSNTALSLIRSAKDGNLQDVYNFLRTEVTNFLRGNPVPVSGLVMKLRHANAAFQMYATLCQEMGTLIDANAGTLGTKQDTIGFNVAKRTWP